ncbi:unnamed protein product [Cunninghamella blakesleeana]
MTSRPSQAEIDHLDEMMASIMQSSIGSMFKQLIEPVDSGMETKQTTNASMNSPPALKLHDFGGSDFKRLAERSRQNRLSLQQQQIQQQQYEYLKSTLLNEDRQSVIQHPPSPPSSPIPNKISPMVDHSKNEKHSVEKDWKCTQECVYRTDGSEETIYQKFDNGIPVETLHYVNYPDGTTKQIKKPTMVSSSSIGSSLSSLSEESTEKGPLRRFWHRIFD